MYVASSPDGTVSVIDTRALPRPGHLRVRAASPWCRWRRRPVRPPRRPRPAHAVRRRLRQQHDLPARHRHLQRRAAGGCPTTPGAGFTVPDGPGSIDVNERPTRRTSPPSSASPPSTPNRATPPPRPAAGTRAPSRSATAASGRSRAVDESTNTIYEADGDQNVAAVDGRACNADDLAGCATAPFGTSTCRAVLLPPARAWSSTRRSHSVYVLDHKDDAVVMVDATVCNGANTDGCASLEPEVVHTGTNPRASRSTSGTHTVYVADLHDDDLVGDRRRPVQRRRPLGLPRLPTARPLDPRQRRRGLRAGAHRVRRTRR